MKGKVKFYNKEKGFGFIVEEGKVSTPEEKNDVFVHFSNIEGGGPLEENDTVEFELEDGPKGPNAKNVKKLITV